MLLFVKSIDFKFINNFFVKFSTFFYIPKNTKQIYYDYSVFELKNAYYRSFKKGYSLSNLLFPFFLSLFYIKKDYKIDLFRSYYRLIKTDNGFYSNFNLLKNNDVYLNFLKNTFLIGFKFIWLAIRFWLIPLIILFTIMYSSLVLRSLPFNKIFFAWIGVVMFCYWLLSGFVFFFKKYQFSKYTSVIQRFWRRTYILFWLIEGGTFAVFLFFTINSSQESFYMFDQISIYKTHLYSWRLFFLKLFPLVLLILLVYFLLVSLKWNVFSKFTNWLMLLTFLLTYIVWLEFYQFFHVLNFYGNLNWIYDIDDHSWILEQEPRRTRIVNHYIMLLFILKFWHVIFIYGFWIFFILRSLEVKRIRYPLLAANLQNFVILYIFAWVFMYPWFKFFFRKFLDTPYYWFYVNNRRLFIRVFFNDFKLIFFSFVDIFKFNFLNRFNHSSFYYWKLSNFENSFYSYRKHFIKNKIITELSK